MPIYTHSRYRGVPITSFVLLDGTVKNLLHRRSYITLDDVGDNFTIHRVTEGETIDFISFFRYGDESLWWVIADVNNLFFVLDELTPGIDLIIPGRNVLTGLNIKNRTSGISPFSGKTIGAITDVEKFVKESRG